MPRRVFQHPAIRGDIADALDYTEEKWGERKKAEYKDLIKEAVAALRENPRLARRRPDIHPQARVHRIAQPGRDAAHVCVFAITTHDDVVLVDYALWLACAFAVALDVASIRRMVRRRRGLGGPSSMPFVTLPVYWLRIAFITLPWTTALLWMRLGQMLVFLVFYALVTYGVPWLLTRGVRPHGSTDAG